MLNCFAIERDALKNTKVFTHVIVYLNGFYNFTGHALMA